VARAAEPAGPGPIGTGSLTKTCRAPTSFTYTAKHEGLESRARHGSDHRALLVVGGTPRRADGRLRLPDARRLAGTLGFNIYPLQLAHARSTKSRHLFSRVLEAFLERGARREMAPLKIRHQKSNKSSLHANCYYYVSLMATIWSRPRGGPALGGLMKFSKHAPWRPGRCSLPPQPPRPRTVNDGRGRDIGKRGRQPLALLRHNADDLPRLVHGAYECSWKAVGNDHDIGKASWPRPPGMARSQANRGQRRARACAARPLPVSSTACRCSNPACVTASDHALNLAQRDHGHESIRGASRSTARAARARYQNT